MKSLAVRLLIAVGTFATGILCAALWAEAGALQAGWLKSCLPLLMLGASVACFVAASLSEARRRARGTEAAIALTLVMLSGGLNLLLIGIWLVWRTWISHSL